jgi:hypothetical protein
VRVAAEALRAVELREAAVAASQVELRAERLAADAVEELVHPRVTSTAVSGCEG